MTYTNKNYEGALKKKVFSLEFEEDKIKKKDNVHESIREKQLRIARLLNSKKNDNFPEKGIGFSLSSKNESEHMDDYVGRKNKFSSINAAISQKLNDTLFRKSSNFKNLSISHSKNSPETSKLTSNNNELFSNKEKSSINNKINEDFKKKINSVLLLRNPPDFHKSPNFEPQNPHNVLKETHNSKSSSNDTFKDTNDETYKKREDLLMQFLKTHSNIHRIDDNKNKNNNLLQIEVKSENNDTSFTEKKLYVDKSIDYKRDQSISSSAHIVEKGKGIFFSYFKNIKEKLVKKINYFYCNNPKKEDYFSEIEEKIDILYPNIKNSSFSNKN